MRRGKHNQAYDPIVFSHLCVLMKKVEKLFRQVCNRKLGTRETKRKKVKINHLENPEKAELNQVVRGKNITAKQGRISSVLKVH